MENMPEDDELTGSTCARCGCEADEDELDGNGYCEVCAEESSERLGECTQFTKFMDNIVLSEQRRRGIVTLPDSPMRLRAARHQERPLNRIRVK